MKILVQMFQNSKTQDLQSLSEGSGGLKRIFVEQFQDSGCEMFIRWPAGSGCIVKVLSASSQFANSKLKFDDRPLFALHEKCTLTLFNVLAHVVLSHRGTQPSESESNSFPWSRGNDVLAVQVWRCRPKWARLPQRLIDHTILFTHHNQSETIRSSIRQPASK
jgi:hypothetical protein